MYLSILGPNCDLDYGRANELLNGKWLWLYARGYNVDTAIFQVAFLNKNDKLNAL